MVNLDRVAAEASQLILDKIGTSAKGNTTLSAKDLERMTTNALGVLQEQGLYAFFLYLLSQSGGKSEQNELKADELASCIIMAQLLLMLNRPEQLEYLSASFANDWEVNPSQINKHKKELLQFISGKICEDLRRLLMVKSFFEQVLIYTRYGAKAVGSSAAEGS